MLFNEACFEILNDSNADLQQATVEVITKGSTAIGAIPTHLKKIIGIFDDYPEVLTAMVTATDPLKKVEKLSIDDFETLVQGLATLGNRLAGFCTATDSKLDTMLTKVEAYAQQGQQQGNDDKKELAWIATQIANNEDLSRTYEEFTKLSVDIEKL